MKNLKNQKEAAIINISNRRSDVNKAIDTLSHTELVFPAGLHIFFHVILILAAQYMTFFVLDRNWLLYTSDIFFTLLNVSLIVDFANSIAYNSIFSDLAALNSERNRLDRLLSALNSGTDIFSIPDELKSSKISRSPSSYSIIHSGACDFSDFSSIALFLAAISIGAYAVLIYSKYVPADFAAEHDISMIFSYILFWFCTFIGLIAGLFFGLLLCESHPTIALAVIVGLILMGIPLMHILSFLGTVLSVLLLVGIFALFIYIN